MRAVAVLVVFANHLFDWPPGGFVGVDVFFVLSGFFITGLLIRERTARRKISFESFYVRRVKRILPSALLVLTVTVIGSWLLFPAARAKQTIVDALYAALFASNFRFEAVGADYFQSAQPPSPLQHYWSLSIEEQFYFVWPALLALIFALTRELRRKGKERAGQWGLLAAMTIIVSASFAWAMYLSAADPNGAYFSSFTRVWELGVGALIAIAGPWLVSIPPRVRPALAYLGLAGVTASLFFISSAVQFPAPWAALPVLSTALVVSAFHGAEVHSMFLLTNPVARWFGDTSYTLYLWHWPILTLLLSVLPPGRLYYIVTIVIAVGLTAVTYRFYENPIRHSNWLLGASARRHRGRLTLSPTVWRLVGGVAAAATLVSILGIQYSDKISSARELAATSGGQQQFLDSTQAAPKSDPCFGAPAMVTPGCVLRNPNLPLQPSIDKFVNDTGSIFSRCYSEKNQENLESCDLGYKGNDAKRIAIIGDSHAAALVPALEPVLEPNKWRLTTYVGATCYLATPTRTACDAHMAELGMELIAHPYDVVLVTNFPGGGVTPEDYQRAWAPIAAAGSRIVVVADNPATSADAMACLTRVGFGGDHTGECGTPRAQAFARPDPLVPAAKLVPGASLIDLSPFYCTADRCPSVIGNVIVYRDLKDNGNSHITATFARTLAPAVQEGIQSALSARPTGSG